MSTQTPSTNLTRRAIEDRAQRIEQYYIQHDRDKKKTYAHFTDEGISKKTVYHVLRRIERAGEVIFKKPSGRKVSVCTPEMFEKVAELFKQNPKLSCREGAKQLGVARTTIFRIMAKMREKNIETYKVIESEPRCPTCHQKIDAKIAEALEKRKNKVKSPKSKPVKSNGTKREEYHDAKEDLNLNSVEGEHIVSSL